MKETHKQSQRLSVGDILNDSVSTNVFNDNNGTRATATGLKNNFREKKKCIYEIESSTVQIRDENKLKLAKWIFAQRDRLKRSNQTLAFIVPTLISFVLYMRVCVNSLLLLFFGCFFYLFFSFLQFHFSCIKFTLAYSQSITNTELEINSFGLNESALNTNTVVISRISAIYNHAICHA